MTSRAKFALFGEYGPHPGLSDRLNAQVQAEAERKLNEQIERSILSFENTIELQRIINTQEAKV